MAIRRGCVVATIDGRRGSGYDSALMSKALPEVVDAWRMVSAGRIFEGNLPLSEFPRLQGYLVDSAGGCDYTLEFGSDAFGIAFLDINVRTRLPLICQRVLDRFELPVELHQRLGLIRDERDEAGLPEGYEAVLVPADGALDLAAAIEDELILAIPVVPMSDAEASLPEGMVQVAVVEAEQLVDDDETRVNPFSVLADLKQRPE
jgi:uncharacterized protein